jgi:hypothetical protein
VDPWNYTTRGDVNIEGPETPSESSGMRMLLSYRMSFVEEGSIAIRLVCERFESDVLAKVDYCHSQEMASLRRGKTQPGRGKWQV